MTYFSLPRSGFGVIYIIHIARMGVFPPGFLMKVSSIHSTA